MTRLPGWVKLRALPMPEPVAEPGRLVFFVPVKLVNTVNERAAHWSVPAKRAQTHRDATAMAIRGAIGRAMRITAALTVPKAIHFEAWVPRLFDDDGLEVACKSVRDGLQGILIDHDGPTSGHAFTYSQKQQGPYGVLITVRLKATAPPLSPP